MKIKNKTDLRWAYVVLGYYEKEYQRCMDDNLRVKINKLKVDIRNYNKIPHLGRFINYDGIDGYVRAMDMPRYFDDCSEREVTEYFKENYFKPRPNSMYDCTGQAFTSWYKVVRRRNKWVVYHSIGFDY